MLSLEEPVPGTSNVLLMFSSIGFVHVHRGVVCFLSPEKVGATLHVIYGKISVKGSNEMGNI